MHVFTLRLTTDLWRRLVNAAHRDRASVNRQITDYIEAALLDSPVGVKRPVEALPWLED
jgi:predicted HicB family RNase H-like nuclease